MAPQKGKKKKEQVISLGPQVAEGENVFGVATSLHPSVTLLFMLLVFLRGNHLLRDWWDEGQADRDESFSYVAVWAAQCVAQWSKGLGTTAPHIKLWAAGGSRTKPPGVAAQSALRPLAHPGMKVGRIEDDPVMPSDSTYRKEGRHGCHL